MLKCGGMENEANFDKEVVLKIVDGMENKGYIGMIHNYFTSIGIFNKLLDKGIYTMIL